ncbi:DUF4388 domain-containing protein, partial [Leptolyngbya sp. FACHB-16]|uniref:DUF4388 domain-containing protein n=1 Tax=unclassified Leptolyngbya TaxID=2650499 RepID=UPI001A7EBD68
LVISIPNCRCDPKLSLRSISLTRQICCRDTSTRLTFDMDGRGLGSKIAEKGWLSQRVIERLNGLAKSGTPLGLTLKMQGALHSEQLNLLFVAQLQQIWALFESCTGQFDLDGQASLPSSEMTGLSASAMEVALSGLRHLKNWHAFGDTLPDGDSAIQSIVPSKPQIRLNSLEWQVWEFAKGTVSLRDTAQQLNQPTSKVQQAAFRLMLVGLVEEVPLAPCTVTASTTIDAFDMLENSTDLPSLFDERKLEEEQKSKMSHSLLQNLVGFLRSKP